MSIPRVVWMFLIGLMGLGAGMVPGQDYPNKPIRILVGGVGGGGDFTARQVAQGISGPLGQPVIVENRASGNLAAEIVYKTPADGYTLHVAGSSLWLLPLLQKTPYQVADYSPITLIETSLSVVVVHPSLPVKSIKELIALAKARPGELNYSSSGIAGAPHLSAELFKSMAGVNMVHVPYKGAAAAMAAVISGEAQMTISGTAVVLGQGAGGHGEIRDGQVEQGH